MAQIGTIRVDTQNNGTVSVPVFDTGDSGSSIYEFVRVQTGSGTGFIPVEDTSDATYPYLRVKSQSHGTVAMTDRNSAIPDSQISFSMPSNGSNTGTDIGGVIQTSQSWPEFQARFDSNTNLASDEELVLADANETELEVIDASNGSPGDIFTFNTALDANEEYRIYGRTPNNNGRDEAFTNSVSFPITSNDGNLEITAGYASNKTGNTRTNLIQHISGYGNLTL